MKSLAPKTRPAGVDVAVGAGVGAGVAVAAGGAVVAEAVGVGAEVGDGGEPQAAIKKIGKTNQRLAMSLPDAQPANRVASGAQ